MNGRLILSTIAIIFSGYALLHDWLHPFPESKSTLACCVLAYFVAIFVLTVYTNYIEKGCFAAAKIKIGNKEHAWKMYSKQKRYNNTKRKYFTNYKHNVSSVSLGWAP
jgi:uncharacterized membrane protein